MRRTGHAPTQLRVVFDIVDPASGLASAAVKQIGRSELSQEASIVQHIDDARNDRELVVGHAQPRVERVHHLSADVLAGHRADMRERLEQCLEREISKFKKRATTQMGTPHILIAFGPRGRLCKDLEHITACSARHRALG